jgi:hypothetical protein
MVLKIGKLMGASYAVCHYNGNLPTHEGVGISALEARLLYHFIYKPSLMSIIPPDIGRLLFDKFNVILKFGRDKFLKISDKRSYLLKIGMRSI